MSMPEIPEGFELIEDEESMDIEENVKVQSPEIPDGFELIEDEKKDETFVESATRNVARTGARAGESILGIPGDIANFIQNIPGALATKLGMDPETARRATEVVKSLSPFHGLKGAGELKELTTKATGEFLKPQSSTEEFADEVTEFVAPLLVPLKGTGALGKAKNIFSTLAKATGATALGNYVGGLTESEGARDATQIGSYVIMSLMNPKKMNNYISKLYKDVENAFPKGGSKLGNIKTAGYRKRLVDFKKDITQSLSPSDSQKTIIRRVDEILEKLPSEVNPKQIWETKKSINTDIGKLMRTAANKPERQLLQNYNKRLSSLTKETLRQHGKINPGLWKAIETADDAFSTKAQTEWMANQLKKTINLKEVPFLAKALPFLLKTGIATGASTFGAPLYYTGRFIARYKKSPALRKYYNDLFKSAAAGNAKMVRNAAQKLNKELEREELKENKSS